MKRKFLEDLGIEKDVVDKIMAENGNDITREQTTANGYKSQLDDVQTKLKSFEGVDVTQLQGQVSELTADLATTKTTYEAQIEGMKFSTALESKINSMNPRNAKAVMALIDVETLKKSKNQDSDITLALEAVKKDNDYLFQADQSQNTKRVVTSTDTTQTGSEDKKTAANEAFRSLFKGE